MNMSRARGPRYSLEYLTFMATKRKRREAGGDEVDMEEGGAKDDGSDEPSAKRPRVRVRPTVTEMMRDVWKEMRADGYNVG